MKSRLLMFSVVARDAIIGCNPVGSPPQATREAKLTGKEKKANEISPSIL
jgi:hypothetical protein